MITVECLRVRQRDEFEEITYKPASTAATHSATDIITKPEANIILSGPDQATAANTLLDVLGLVRLCRVEKTRTTFCHPNRGDVTVVIDLITDIGAFAETKVMADDPTAAATLLDRVERQLGLTELPIVSLPYAIRSSNTRRSRGIRHRKWGSLIGPPGVRRPEIQSAFA